MLKINDFDINDDDLIVEDSNGEAIAIISEVHNKIEEILDYSDEEKEEINQLMNFVFKIDKLKNEGKSFPTSGEYNMFIMGYRQASNRIKKHFKEIYIDLVITAGITKINSLLNMKSTIGLNKHIRTILFVNESFDFNKEFNNDEINNIVASIRN